MADLQEQLRGVMSYMILNPDSTGAQGLAWFVNEYNYNRDDAMTLLSEFGKELTEIALIDKMSWESIRDKAVEVGEPVAFKVADTVYRKFNKEGKLTKIAARQFVPELQSRIDALQGKIDILDALVVEDPKTDRDIVVNEAIFIANSQHKSAIRGLVEAIKALTT